MHMKNLTRTATVALAVAVTVLQGSSPVVLPIIAALTYALYRLADHGLRATDRALALASARRVAELTWELRTAAAAQELYRRRRVAAYQGAVAAGVVHYRASDDNLYTPPGGLPLLRGYAA